MGACAAVSTTYVDPCGAIPCILRQFVHNKDDYNEDDHTGFPFAAFREEANGPTIREGYNGVDSVPRVEGGMFNVLPVGKRL